MTLDNLEAYTTYLVQVSVGNYYTKHRTSLSAEPPGNPTLLRTLEGGMYLQVLMNSCVSQRWFV